jgi:CheY-like chemotaxis protein
MGNSAVVQLFPAVVRSNPPGNFLPHEQVLKRSTLPAGQTTKRTGRDVFQPASAWKLLRFFMSSPPLRPLVLLVEDSEDDAFFFRWTLDKCQIDCEIDHAIDGAAAIQQLEAGFAVDPPRRPDLVFLDLKIPTLSGFEVLSWIRNRHFNPPLDVAVLSGSEHASDVQRAHSLGATAYYVKPISVEQLRSRFAEWHARNDARTRAGPAEAHACTSPTGPA